MNATTLIVREAMRIVAKDVRSPKCVRDGLVKPKNMEILICTNAEKFPINEIGPKLVLGKEYVLESKFKCGCGEDHYDVGLPLEINYVECYKCRERLPENIHWCHSSRFELKTEQPYTTGNGI